MSQAITAHGHCEHLVFRQAKLAQKIENGQRLGRCELMVCRRGGLNLCTVPVSFDTDDLSGEITTDRSRQILQQVRVCLLYTSDAADE